MPTYEYECQKCGHQFEVFQSMKDNALEVCPAEKCARKSWGKGKVQRRLGTGAGLIFKGSGFYITDYRSEGYKSAAKKEKESSSPSTTPTKSDAKPSSSPGTGSKPPSKPSST